MLNTSRQSAHFLFHCFHTRRCGRRFAFIDSVDLKVVTISYSNKKRHPNRRNTGKRMGCVPFNQLKWNENRIIVESVRCFHEKPKHKRMKAKSTHAIN